MKGALVCVLLSSILIFILAGHGEATDKKTEPAANSTEQALDYVALANHTRSVSA